MYHKIFRTDTSQRLRWSLWQGLVGAILFMAATACTSDRGIDDDAIGANIQLRLGAINTNDENRVDNLRLIIADARSKQIVFNQHLQWDNKAVGTTRPVRLDKSGHYDFFIIANDQDSQYAPLKEQLDRSAVLFDLYPSAEIASNNTFVPSESERFSYTSVLRNVEVKGGTAATPQPIEATLVRHFAKVTVNVQRELVATGADHIVVKRVYLDKIAAKCRPIFQFRPYKELLGLANATTWQSLAFAEDIPLSNYGTSQVLATQNFYIPELLINRGEENDGTQLVVEYWSDKAKSGAIQTKRINIDTQSDSDLPAMVQRLGAEYSPANTDNLSLKSVFRNLHYTINVSIKDARLEPVMNIDVAPWEVVSQEVRENDLFITPSKKVVLLNHEKGDQTKLMLLSNIKNATAVTIVPTYADPNDTNWASISNATTLQGNQEFVITALSEHRGRKPRSMFFLFKVDNYELPIKVYVTQRPRADIITRHYANFVAAGGGLDIPVDALGYTWRAEVVENYSTIATGDHWIQLTHSADKLHINVAPIVGDDLMRYALVKVYDASQRASYIWVEQGAYKPITVPIGGGKTMVILDRNLGAVKAPTNINAWSDDTPIQGSERVLQNGFYYQWGRMPDGYHWAGIDLVHGTLDTFIPGGANGFQSDEALDYTTHPECIPYKWNDRVQGEMQDKQRGRFITKSPWITNLPADVPLWTAPNKNPNLDPCPEGYRIPTWEELGGMFNTARDNHTLKNMSFGVWLSGTNENGESHHLYFPWTAYRSESSQLVNWGDINQSSYYALCSPFLGYVPFALDITKKKVTWKLWEAGTPASVGMVVRCVKEND